MVRSYLRHGPTQAFGLICSSGANSLFDGKLAYAPALEDVLVWDVKKNIMTAMWHDTGCKDAVTCVARSPQVHIFAIGHSDGSIRLWNSSDNSVVVRLNGHKKAITALAFDAEGSRLASGSQDTDIIIWDIIASEGVKRLSGHRDQITGIQFLPSSDPSSSSLLTIAKDTLMKLWDLKTWYCIETVIAHRTEVWSLDIDPDGKYIFTGSSEGELKAWSLNTENLSSSMDTDVSKKDQASPLRCLGSLSLSSSQRVTSIVFHKFEPYVAIQSHDRSVEVFRIRSEDEIRKKQSRRRKRAKQASSDAPPEESQAPEEDKGDFLTDLVSPYIVVRPSGKVRSFGFPLDNTSPSNKNLQLFVALTTNALEVYSISMPPKTKDKSFVPESIRSCGLELPGHRTDVRALSVSSDDTLLASASNGQVKIWNLKTLACIRTMECGYGLSCAFIPGNKHVVVGTKTGRLLLLDVASAAVLSDIPGHESSIWSMCLDPSERILISGSADKHVKVWEIARQLDQRTEEQADEPSPYLRHAKTLKLGADVLAVRLSPNGKYLAVALLDSTVKIFYRDTLKFYLSLYGHKLPVLSMDISHDSKLLVTCSADKSVKIWGMDYGDCHRSLFAHEESVMQVAFEAQSHYFWSVGKDRLLKYWDGDKFVNIQKLEGHHGEIWALALSNQGNFVVTASHDKSIRVWEKLDDPLFLEEERERDLEAIYDAGIAKALNQNTDGTIGGEGTSLVANEAGEVTKQTTDTLMAGERLIDALDLADKEKSEFQEFEIAKSKLSEEEAARLPPPARNPVLAAYDVSPEIYVLNVIQKIPPSSLTDALMILPFAKILSLLAYLNEWVAKDQDLLLVSRVLFFLLKTYHQQIASNRIMRASLIPLRKNLRGRLQQRRDLIAYNLSALKFMKQSREDSASLEDESIDKLNEDNVRTLIQKANSQKRKRVRV